MTPPKKLPADPSTPCYIEGYGVTTLGEIVAQVDAAPADSRARTLAMWGYIATHPDAKPWLRNSGRTRVANGGSTE